MNYQKNVWNQLKNKSADDFLKALKKDNWILDSTSGVEQIFYHPTKNRRVSIHYHPNKTYQQGLLKSLLADTGWSIQDMKRLKFIK